MIDIDEELEWVRADRQDRHVGVISKHECVVDVYWVEELLTEVERLRSIADDLYAYIVSDADISLSTIEEQMDWREEE